MRAAVLADVHGNAPALAAVLAELEREPLDRIVFLGDLSWGSFPHETVELALSLGERAEFVRGNADRDLVAYWDEVADGGAPASERVRWMTERHTRHDRDFVAGFRDTITLDVAGLGETLFCHGSPRSLEELVTEQTPDERMAELLHGVSADTLVTAHTHVRFERRVHGKRVLNPGSVGLPYAGRPGAYWAVLGPEVEFRRTAYDVEAVAAHARERRAARC